ncbi:hypothetical protein C2E23DRAFT_173551 [Lenzites betulinus]|nr:hypothetical protein C2E23DRAFT_173551 [Lenzites betulinus]
MPNHAPSSCVLNDGTAVVPTASSPPSLAVSGSHRPCARYSALLRCAVAAQAALRYGRGLTPTQVLLSAPVDDPREHHLSPALGRFRSHLGEALRSLPPRNVSDPSRWASHTLAIEGTFSAPFEWNAHSRVARETRHRGSFGFGRRGRVLRHTRAATTSRQSIHPILRGMGIARCGRAPRSDWEESPTTSRPVLAEPMSTLTIPSDLTVPALTPLRRRPPRTERRCPPMPACRRSPPRHGLSGRMPTWRVRDGLYDNGGRVARSSPPSAALTDASCQPAVRTHARTRSCPRTSHFATLTTAE